MRLRLLSLGLGLETEKRVSQISAVVDCVSYVLVSLKSMGYGCERPWAASTHPRPKEGPGSHDH